ncbi:hypothetical protein PR048_016276 [Dryococelus australis]|uniref:Uncharacterized protein n=1 Tax=Dryococelus australis TaxID=614101 RepID=A0ABQ9HJ99_9NEOP|nr:hypothetical protein PR048_016276 [Dryococelus australis]
MSKQPADIGQHVRPASSSGKCYLPVIEVLAAVRHDCAPRSVVGGGSRYVPHGDPPAMTTYTTRHTLALRQQRASHCRDSATPPPAAPLSLWQVALRAAVAGTTRRCSARVAVAVAVAVRPARLTNRNSPAHLPPAHPATQLTPLTNAIEKRPVGRRAKENPSRSERRQPEFRTSVNTRTELAATEKVMSTLVAAVWLSWGNKREVASSMKRGRRCENFSYSERGGSCKGRSPGSPRAALHVHIPGRVTLNFRMWESCRTMPLLGGFSRGSPVSPALSFRHCLILTSITLTGSQDLDVTSRRNLFTHSLVSESRMELWRIVNGLLVRVDVDAGGCCEGRSDPRHAVGQADYSRLGPRRHATLCHTISLLPEYSPAFSRYTSTTVATCSTNKTTANHT